MLVIIYKFLMKLFWKYRLVELLELSDNSWTVKCKYVPCIQICVLCSLERKIMS